MDVLLAMNSTPSQQNTKCTAYYQQGYCLKGNFCPFEHSGSILVADKEFFYEWHNISADWNSKKSFQSNIDTVNTQSVNIDANNQKDDEEKERINKYFEMKKRQKELEDQEQQRQKQKEEEYQKLLKLRDTKLKQMQSQQQQQQQPQSVNNVEIEEHDVPTEWKDVDFQRPRIPLSLYYKFPVHIRQTALDKLVIANTQKLGEDKRKEAVIKAMQTEIEIYNKSSSQNIYWVEVLHACKRVSINNQNEKV